MRANAPTVPFSAIGILSPALHRFAACPDCAACLMVAGVLSSSVGLATSTVTLNVLSAGAVWLVPSAHLTVMVALPVALPVTVMVVPFTLTVATPGSLDVALIAPLPLRVAVTVPVVVPPLKVRLLLFRLKLPAALLIFHVMLFAVVVPSLHW